jgi:ATP phosphoribosyltransferase
VIRLALPKGRNLKVALAAFRAAGVALADPEPDDRRLQMTVPLDGLEVLFLKDWDVPLYVQHGVADCGVVGSDVLDEVDGDLLVPARFRHGTSRLSFIGRGAEMPEPGQQIRLATKYPATARRLVQDRPWGAEILELSGSVELAPILDLAELALDIVQTGRTLAENRLRELETVCEVAPCLVVNRGAFQLLRREINRLLERFEEARMVV